MNKLTIVSILIVGLAAVALASPTPTPNPNINLEDAAQFEEISQLEVEPSNENEIAHLSEEHKIFADFCRRSRDVVYTFIHAKNNEMISSVFAAFFSGINEVTTRLQDIQKSEGAKATEAIKEGKVEESAEQSAEESTEQTDEETGEQTEKSAGLLKVIGGALSSYAKAVVEAAANELVTRLNYLKSSITTENFKDFITQTCTNIQLQLQPDLQKLFKQYKADVAKEESTTPEQKEILANAAYEKVGCLTTGRARKVVNVCGFLNTAGPMVYSMMGI